MRQTCNNEPLLSLARLLLLFAFILPVAGYSHGIPSGSAQADITDSFEQSPSYCVDRTIHCEKFSTITTAVQSAANRYNPPSIREDREYLGTILKNRHHGHFIYTVGAGLSGVDQVTVRVRIPKDYEVVAFWHTHGAEHWTRRYFSDIDTRLSKRWQLPFYMTNHTGELLVFEPGQPTLSPIQTRRLGLGKKRGYATGRQVMNPQSNSAVKIATRNVLMSQVEMSRGN